MNTSEYLSMGDAARLLGVTKARISHLPHRERSRAILWADGRWLSMILRSLIKRSANVDAVLRPMWDASLR